MSEIRLEKCDAIATVTLANPGKLNALDVAMWRALAATFTQISQDESLRCVIVRGDDHNFAAGADIEEFPAVRATMAQGTRYHTETIAQALCAIADCRHPTIAAIEGVCVGGGLEIACASGDAGLKIDPGSRSIRGTLDRLLCVSIDALTVAT